MVLDRCLLWLGAAGIAVGVALAVAPVAAAHTGSDSTSSTTNSGSAGSTAPKSATPHPKAAVTASNNDSPSPKKQPTPVKVAPASTVTKITTTTTPTFPTTVRTAQVAHTPAAATPPSPIAAIGSLVFNVLTTAINAFVGPPVLPPGSTVTVRQSTLQIGTVTAPADWYFPAGPAPPKGLIYLQHGFLASGPMYSYTAATLAQQTDSVVVAPSLSSNFFAPGGNWLGGVPMQRAVADLFVGDRTALTASASAAAGHPVSLPLAFVLIGHSLGGGLAAAAAGYTVDNGASRNLAGVVLFDPVGNNGAIPTAMAKLPADIPVLMIASPPYFWNEFGGAAVDMVKARPGQFVGVQLVGGRHIDSMQGGNPLIQFSAYLAAGFSQPQNIAAVQTLSVGWINDMYNGTRNGIYAKPGQTISIPTSAGTATAIALPAPPTPLSPLTDLARTVVALGSNILFGLFGPPAAATAAAQTQDLTQLSASGSV